MHPRKGPLAKTKSYPRTKIFRLASVEAKAGRLSLSLDDFYTDGL